MIIYYSGDGRFGDPEYMLKEPNVMLSFHYHTNKDMKPAIRFRRIQIARQRAKAKEEDK